MPVRSKVRTEDLQHTRGRERAREPTAQKRVEFRDQRAHSP